MLPPFYGHLLSYILMLFCSIFLCRINCHLFHSSLKIEAAGASNIPDFFNYDAEYSPKKLN
jgi:hypothetical protein